MEIDYCQLWNIPIQYLNVEKPIKGFVALKEWFECLSR
jgi:hypothetical protein